MDNQESLDFKGVVLFELFDKDGNFKESRTERNLICQVGKNKLMAISSAEYVNAFSYIAIGTSTTAASSSDTALGTEVARSTVITPTNPSNMIQWVYTFPAGTGTGAITECGLFDASSSGNILSHLVFSAINKGASDTLQITYQIS